MMWAKNVSTTIKAIKCDGTLICDQRLLGHSVYVNHFLLRTSPPPKLPPLTKSTSCSQSSTSFQFVGCQSELTFMSACRSMLRTFFLNSLSLNFFRQFSTNCRSMLTTSFLFNKLAALQAAHSRLVSVDALFTIFSHTHAHYDDIHRG